MSVTEESRRLDACSKERVPWKKWGPYLSERQWGTVREDYSDDGDAWDYFTHDQARSRAYRWGEDGLAGICDDKQRLCFALALWNGQDPILKERLFGADQRRGQPRRGREGVLLLPRQHAHPLVHEVAVQVPAGGVPLHRPGRDQRAAQPAGVGVRAAGHRRLRRGPLLRRVGRIRQGGARGHPDPHHASATAARRRRRCTCCPRCGSATPGPGARRRRAARPGMPVGAAIGKPGARRVGTPSWASTWLHCRGRRAAAVHARTRRTPSGCSGSPTPALRQGRHRRLRRPRRHERGEPGEWAPRPPPTTGWHVAPGAGRGRPPAPDHEATPARCPSRRGTRSTHVLRRSRDEADEFYESITPPSPERGPAPM